MTSRAIWGLIGLGVTACAIPAPDDVAAVEQSIAGGCTEDFCMHNSPEIATYGMFDFNVDGLENAAGFAIWGLIKDNVSYDLLVRDSRIVGQINGTDYLVDKDLIGAEIVLQSKQVGQVAIVIEDVGSVQETVSPNLLQTYVLDWGKVVGRVLQKPIRGGYWVETPIADPSRTPLCHIDLTNWTAYGANPLEWEETWSTSFGSNVYQSLVFEGDRIEPVTRTVAQNYDDRWFNVGCDAHTLTKMRLSRNTIHTGGWRAAQAALKMLSADYCGTGRPFTVDGEQLLWRATSGMTFYNPRPKTLEARWSEDGALCVADPRLRETAIPDAVQQFPDIWKAIESECEPRKCEDLDPNHDELKDELITSANY